MISLLLVFTFIISIQSVMINQKLCNTTFEIDISNGIFKENNTIEFEGVLYGEENYYYYNYTGSVKLYLGCPCDFNRCFRKCCPNGQMLQEDNTCIPMPKQQQLNLYIYEHDDKKTNLNLKDFVPFYGSTCQTGSVYIINPDRKGNFYLQKDGSLFYEIENYGDTRQLGKYCIDFLYEENREEFNAIALACTQDEIVDNTIIRNAYAACMITALPFILLTFLIYALIPELRKSNHGKCIACYSISYFIASFILSMIYMFSIYFPQKLCVATAYITYTFFMASFFWLNIMCIDVWWTFKGSKGFKKTENEGRKFIIYSCYAWGSAILSLIIAIVFQYMNTYLIPSYIVRPEIGTAKCWFSNTSIQGYYMYGPILAIIIINCILFIWTGINIFKVKRETKQLMQQAGDSQRHSTDCTSEFQFYLKLFLAFGINWGFEVFPWLTNTSFEWQWVLDVVNMLYGIFIFILSCCNKKVLNLLKKKFNIVGNRINSLTYTTNTNSNKSTTSTASAKVAVIDVKTD